ncbi:hypothetical protein Tco_0098018 [Tanacetum coccineum]
MDASDGSREEKDDDHQSNRRKLNLDRLGCKNVEGSDRKSSDEVPQSSDQMEVVEDATGGRGRMFGNNDRVGENSNAEFISSQMDIRGSVGVVGGQFGNELVQSSDNSDVWNQRKRPQGQNTGSSSHGMALDHGNLLVQSTSGTQLVLHSESSNVLGQGHGQGTSGTGSVLHSDSSSRNVHGQGQQGMHSQSVTPTATQYQHGRFTVTHEQPSAISGVSRPRGVHEHNVRVRSDPNVASGNNLRPRGPLAQSGSDTHTYQRGTGFFMPRGQNTGNTGSSSHGTALDHGNMLGQSTSGTQLVLHSESSNVLDQGQGLGTDGTGSVLHSGSSNGHGQGQQGMYSQSVTPAATQYQRGRFTVTHEQPSAISGFQEHNLRVQSDPNMVRANMFRQGTPQVSQQIGFFGTPINPFFPTFASQNAGLPVAWPPVQSGTGFFMPRRVQEHNMRVPSDANMVSADMFRQGTPQMSQQIGCFGTPMNPFFPTFASQNAGLPVARPPVHMGMSSNADMAVEARDREEVVSDQGSTSEDS